MVITSHHSPVTNHPIPRDDSLFVKCDIGEVGGGKDDGEPSVKGNESVTLEGRVEQFQAGRFDEEGDGEPSAQSINPSPLREMGEKFQAGKFVTQRGTRYVEKFCRLHLIASCFF